MRKQFILFSTVVAFAAAAFTLLSAFDTKQQNTETYYYQLLSTDPSDENNQTNWTTTPPEGDCVFSADILCEIIAPEGLNGHPDFDFSIGESVRNSPDVEVTMYKQVQ